MRVVHHDETLEEDIPFASLLRTKSPQEPLEIKFRQFARREIALRTKVLSDAVDHCGGKLDVIHISGKTTYLPVVTEVLSEQFPRVLVVRALRPKECVVTGACQARASRRGSVVIDLDAEAQRMTSTIGAFSLTSPFFQPILQVDQMIPAEGLTGELEKAWDGIEPVVLWENLGGAENQIPESDASKKLDRLGAWIPDLRRPAPAGQEWNLHVRLQNFRLSVEAVSSGGETVAFRPIHGSGE
jgi:hypothetical protein